MSAGGKTSVDYSLLVQVVHGAGDVWLCADSVAILLGMFTPSGQPSRRGFLEKVAMRGSFPKPLSIGNTQKWRKSEVMAWAEDERKIAA